MTQKRTPHLDEFQRIARFFAPLAGKGALGLADDIALIDGPAGTQYALKTDTIVENVHFFADDPPDLIAKKLLRVNLSDLAAKGVAPIGYLFSMALPPLRDEAWLGKFARGLAEDQRKFGIALLGGDSVRIDGPVTLTVAAIGQVTKGKVPSRSGARPGDRIYVSGTLGDAALGLKLLQKKHALARTKAKNKKPEWIKGLSSRHRRFLIDRYRLPQSRFAIGLKIARTASAAMDISDGLVADLEHICSASKVGATIETAWLPLSPAARAALKADPSLLQSVLGGGDDYEILFTARHVPTSLPVTKIGRIEKGRGVVVVDPKGKPIKVAKAGYRHA